MKIELLSEEKVIGLINQLQNLALELTDRILENHRKGDSELYHKLVADACEFYDDYYNAYLIEVQKGNLPAKDRLTREQIAADLEDNFDGFVRKVECMLYAALEEICNFGVIKITALETCFLFPSYGFYGEEMMKRVFETPADSQIFFYSIITEITEDVYTPFFQFAFMAIDLLGYEWFYISKQSVDDQNVDFQDVDDNEYEEEDRLLLDDLAARVEQLPAPEADEESQERLDKINNYLSGRGFSAKRNDTDDSEKYNVPPVIVGYFDWFGRFPDGYLGED
ncbi:MAG: hypothetical protein V4594_01435 [Bacteroidota bacterium]